MRTYGPAEGLTQPLLHAWRLWVNINATRCRSLRTGLGPEASRREDSLSGSQERKETGGGGRGEEACDATAQFVDERGGLRATAQHGGALRGEGGLERATRRGGEMPPTEHS